MYTEAIYSPDILGTLNKAFSRNEKHSSRREQQLVHEQRGLGQLFSAFAEQLTGGLTQIREKITAPKEFNIWSSQRYFDAYALAQNPQEQAGVYNQLDPDLESVFDEHSFARLSVCYEYGRNGIRNGYSQSMADIAVNFLESLKAQGRPIERAELEVVVAQYAQAWIDSSQVQVGEKLVFISPRGSEAELYPGLKEENHVFVNILEKTESGVLFYEFRNYDTHAELPKLQQRLLEKSGGFNQVITDRHADYHTQPIITNFLHLPPHCSLSQIVQEVHFNKGKWKVNIDTQLPKLSETEVKNTGLKVRKFCIAKFKELVVEDIPHTEKVKAFDDLIKLVRKEVNKWVENNATNYDTNKQKPYELHLYTQDSDVLASEHANPSVESIWQIKRKKARGTALEKAEKKALSEFSTMTMLNPALPFKRIASLAHCIVVTPTSLMKLQSMSSLNPSLLSSMDIENNWLATISLEERKNYIAALERYVRIELNGEVWYVPPDYLEGKGCYVDPATGLVMGPCGLPLSHPLETNAKPEKEYFELLHYLKTEATSERALESLSIEQQEKVITLYSNLLKYLFVSSASFEKIFHQDILKREDEILEDYTEVYEQLQPSLTPLATLLTYLVRLSQSDFTKITALETAAAKTDFRTNIHPVLN